MAPDINVAPRTALPARRYIVMITWRGDFPASVHPVIPPAVKFPVAFNPQRGRRGTLIDDYLPLWRRRQRWRLGDNLRGRSLLGAIDRAISVVGLISDRPTQNGSHRRAHQSPLAPFAVTRIISDYGSSNSAQNAARDRSLLSARPCTNAAYDQQGPAQRKD